MCHPAEYPIAKDTPPRNALSHIQSYLPQYSASSRIKLTFLVSVGLRSRCRGEMNSELHQSFSRVFGSGGVCGHLVHFSSARTRNPWIELLVHVLGFFLKCAIYCRVFATYLYIDVF